MKFRLVSASTSEHLLMRFVPEFLLFLRIRIFSSVHNVHWSVPIVFMADIGFELFSTLKLISARSSCLDSFLSFGRMY